jgi:hypothetical protein
MLRVHLIVKAIFSQFNRESTVNHKDIVRDPVVIRMQISIKPPLRHGAGAQSRSSDSLHRKPRVT